MTLEPPADVARLRSIQVATPEDHGEKGADDPLERHWRTSNFREPVDGPRWLGEDGLEGDAVGDPIARGGTDKAVCVYLYEHYSYWRAQVGADAEYAMLGENFTIEGLTETEACVGDVFAVGDSTIQITNPRAQCWKVARRWGVTEFPIRMENTE
jgi:MOSC domain-containing protein YiiM